uniref:CG-1 domain-containing protein n=1 Tax=Kalanchoe fedtschenkoi TaxID=63787 RepID=A0A7N0U5J7_KALFE
MDSNSRRHVLGNQLDIEQILLEAQHRWLRPAEICEILQNYKSFRICPEPADKPPSGSLFLFDRKVLRYFRKDGHNWRKKKDGKTVKEAHERLKAGSVDVLHCYYAHGEANESFQRRSYWMLEESLSHIVLVHYRDVKGNRTSISRTRENVERSHAAWEAGDNLSESEISNSASSSMQRSSYQNHSPTIDTSLSSMHASQYEDAESAYNDLNSSRHHSLFEVQTHVNGNLVGSSNTYYTVSNYQDKRSDYGGVDITSLTRAGTSEDGAGLGYERQKHNDFPSWEHVLKNCAGEIPSMGFESSLLSARPDNTGNIFKQESHKLGQLMTDGFTNKQEIASDVQYQGEWLTSDGFSSDLSKWPLDIEYNSNADGQETGSLNLLGSMESSHSHPNEPDEPPKLEPQGMKHPLLQGPVNEDGLRKLDSFNRWMSKELGDVDDSIVQSSSGAYWSAVESENVIDDSGSASQGHLDADMVGPSLSMDQLFSIIDFSPNWAYEDSEIKVLITGKFLKGQSEVEKLKWSCMFGEIEVPAEVIADGVLRCLAPYHKYGRVPFYVTCSNRFACSEVREFEFRAHPVQGSVDADASKEQEIIFHMRLLKLLSLGLDPPDYDSKVPGDNSSLSAKISDLMNEDEDEWDQMLKTPSAENFPSERMKDQLIQKLLKEKLHVWLLHKASEGGKGANVLDEDGQGVLHLAAALGYGWAIPPTILAGVNINFRDVNGWTALHWAAFCGRERTVASLISLGAAAGALTDPTPKYPSGRTAADLASMNRHKGIAGYLAENALAAHLISLDLKDPVASDAVDVSGVKAVQAVAERDANPITDSHIPYISLKDSLTAVCNATQAAARITQVFRAQSFQRKQVQEYEDNERSSEAALSHIALKQQNAFHGGPVDAATRIQKNYRSYKGRKEYLIIRQKIVKLQAHVRGHQVRKNYRKFIWSVGILEKVILRWRRKGSGLRGFKPEGQIEAATSNASSSKEDDYDFFKEGRKQTEERLQKALARVKSMVQYPESRAQYQRLLNVVSEIEETKGAYDRALNAGADEMADFDDDLIDLEALLDADEMDSLMMAES